MIFHYIRYTLYIRYILTCLSLFDVKFHMWRGTIVFPLLSPCSVFSKCGDREITACPLIACEKQRSSLGCLGEECCLNHGQCLHH